MVGSDFCHITGLPISNISITFFVAYGLTETGGGVIATPGHTGIDKYKPLYPGSVGVLLPGQEGMVSTSVCTLVLLEYYCLARKAW